MKYTKTTLQKLQTVFDEMDYTIRYERGNFQSGYCIVENNKIAVINKFFDVEARINTLLEILGVIEIDESLFSDSTLDFYKKITKSFSAEKATEEEVDDLEALIAETQGDDE